MKLENHFTVPVSVDRVWPVLLDIARVASCLPGASIEPGAEDGVFHGTMKIKLGPVTTVYQGIARLLDVDDDTHTASIAVEAREAKGQGTASAVITNRLESADGGTRVVAATDLAVTGRQAQFGRGIMQDVATRLMGEFAARFEEQLTSGAAEQRVAPIATSAGPRAAVAEEPSQPSVGAASSEAAAEPLDLGNVLAGSPKVRAAGAGVGLLVLVLLAVLLGGRRPPKGLSVDLRFRR